jgi:membrane-bound lytic murein transglycosylase D
MKYGLFILMFSFSGVLYGQQQAHYKWTKEDSLKGEAIIRTIEQSLDAFYADFKGDPKYDSIIESLEYESDDIPTFSDEIYCQRLERLNDMSPFHLDCNDITLARIKFFATKRRGFARVTLGRAELYFDLFEEKLAEYDLPIELKYLAVIESGLRPQIKSRAGALGLWQFMYRTGRYYGLTENSYIDERMDPAKATDAACRFLKKLFDIYGDWNLALAAYNAGPGNVNKAIRRSGNKLTYWEIRPYLPKETQGYVPNFIAATYLLTYHAEHNIIPAEANIKFAQLDTMCLKKGVHMETIADLITIDLEDVQALNPIYKQSYIPYTIEGECISLPLKKIGELVALEDSLYNLEFKRYSSGTMEKPSSASTNKKPETSPSYSYHKVLSGENLSAIASRYGTTVEKIKQINGLTSNKIVVGQRLKVKPSGSSSTVGSDSQTSSSRKYYTVKSGDTFGRIAQRNKMSISQLKRLNPGINIDRLSIGQKIRIR